MKENAENNKINPVCFSDYKDYVFTKLDIEKQKGKSEFEKIIIEIQNRQKERDSKPYIFQK